MDKLIKKVLMSKATRHSVILVAFVVAVVGAGSPWFGE